MPQLWAEKDVTDYQSTNKNITDNNEFKLEKKL